MPLVLLDMVQYPTCAYVCFNVARTYYALGQYGSVVVFYRKALRFVREAELRVGVLAGLALSLEKTGRTAEAEKVYEENRPRYPKVSAFREGLARLNGVKDGTTAASMLVS